MYKVESELGFIEFRLPNVPEALLLMGKMGISSNVAKIQEDDGQAFVLMSKLISNIGPMITKVSIKDGDALIDSYEKACESLACMNLLSLASGRILEGLNGGSVVKKK